MIRKVAHIGLAVKSVEDSLKLYEGAFGLNIGGIHELPDRGVRVAMIAVGNGMIELLEPMEEDSPVAKFIEKKGEGIHHIAFEVTDIDEALKILKEKNVELVTPKPYIGAHGGRVAFLSPKSCHGVLIELCEVIKEVKK